MHSYLTFSALDTEPGQGLKPCIRPTSPDWENHREIIRKHYLKGRPNGRLTLSRIQYLMVNEHRFSASINQYKTRMRKWGFRRNITKDMARKMAHIQDKRLNVDKKQTVFSLCGVPISEDRLKRARETHNFGIDSNISDLDQEDIPSYLGFNTPEPQNEVICEDREEDIYTTRAMGSRMGGAEREADFHYDDSLQDSTPISEDWVDVTDQELKLSQSVDSEADSMNTIVYVEAPELPNCHLGDPEKLSSSQLIDIYGSAFLGMVTSAHHSWLLKAEGHKITRSAELWGCIWMSSGWIGKGYMGKIFKDDATMSESWSDPGPDYSNKEEFEQLEEYRLEYLLGEAMRGSIMDTS